MRAPLAERFTVLVFDEIAGFFVGEISFIIDAVFQYTTFRIGFIFGDVVHHGLDHGDGRGIERGFRSANFSDDLPDFGNGVDCGVSDPEGFACLLDGGVRCDSWHVEERAFVERGAEFSSEAGEFLRGIRP